MRGGPGHELHVERLGLLDLAGLDLERPRRRTKSLRNLSLSGPFMHSGQFATLEEVVTFYNAGAQQQNDLVAFMRVLSGEPVPAELLVDTSK